MFLLTESQKKNQPKYIDFIITLFGNSSRYFSSKWYKEFPWLHYNLDKDAAICYTCMSAEIKGLKAICHNNDEAFITHGYKNYLHHDTQNEIIRLMAFMILKAHKCRFENLPKSLSSCQNNMLKISH